MTVRSLFYIRLALQRQQVSHHFTGGKKLATKRISRNYSHRPFKITAVSVFTVVWTVNSSSA